jgi:2-polyprenyl-6-methoxyphenol hydroxylase-like FAD-dependent oxidoreductase
MQIVVIGGGIGGLACAIGLRNGGHDVTVLEKVPAIAEACNTLFKIRPITTNTLIDWSGHQHHA